MFLQIHTLTPYTGVLLNRDDVGFAKRLPVGGVTRTRISSQCLKRHWRQHDGPDGVRSVNDVKLAVRSRESFDELVRQRLVGAGVAEDVAFALTEAIMDHVGLKLDDKAKKKGKTATGQVTVLGPKELDYLLGEARELVQEVSGDTDKKLQKSAKDAVTARSKDKDWKKNLKALGAGLDVALFGRMVTGDIFAGTDAAIHVAHAFTVHSELSESDYFSAMDDLLEERGEVGSGHINTQELNSGLFYGYVVVDVPLLVSNLNGTHRASWRDGDRSLAGTVVEQLLKTITTVTPGAKLGSTAPYSRASFACVETSEQQPCTFANAFLKPVAVADSSLAEALRVLDAHVAKVDEAYGFDGKRAHLSIADTEVSSFGEQVNLSTLAQFASAAVQA